MFNPQRLDLARKRCRMSSRILAEKAQISTITLSRIINGKQNPDDETKSKLISALGYPSDFFYLSDIDDIEVDAASFRSMTSMTAIERDAALSAGMIGYELIDIAKSKFDLPSPDLIDLSHERFPEAAAKTLRTYWGIGERPIGHIIGLLETKGVRVFSLSENTKSVDAFSCWRNDEPYVFLNTFKTPERTRFDAAHELGHLILHKHGGPNQRYAEIQANEFASAFLMPANDFRSLIPKSAKIDYLMKAKARWGVSLSAVAMRARKLDLLSEWEYRNIAIHISQYYGKKEPKGIEREYSFIWKKLLQEMWKDGITKETLSKELCIPAFEIDNLVFGLTPISEPPIKKYGTPDLRVVK